MHHGNRTFARQGKYIEPGARIVITDYPKNLRFMARRLGWTHRWIGEALEKVAARWDDDQHRAENIQILEEILAHSNQLTAAQTSRIKTALKKLEDNDV